MENGIHFQVNMYFHAKLLRCHPLAYRNIIGCLNSVDSLNYTIALVSFLPNLQYVDHIEIPSRENFVISSFNSSEHAATISIFIHFVSDEIGLGLFTRTLLQRGDKVCQYAGELLRSNEEQTRRTSYDAEGLNYILTIREHETTSSASESRLVLKTHIDATRKGNLSRFINHSCDPNLEVIMLRSPCQVIGVPVFFALRTIYPYEELTFHYGQSEEEFGAKRLKNGDSDSRSLPVGKRCLCGAENCLKFLTRLW